MTQFEQIKAGDELEACVVESVDPARLKTMAALYDDPNPIHFDLEATKALGISDKLIQQGAANIAFLLEPAIRFAGDPEAVRSYEVKLQGNIFAGDRVDSSGEVVEVDAEARTVTVALSSVSGERPIAEATAVLAF